MPENTSQSVIDTLSRQVEDLLSREQIRTCLYRVNRGMDRIDVEMFASGFFPDAKVRWGTPEPLDLDTWMDAALNMLRQTQRAQHLLGNILIDLHGDAANVESYEIGRHLTPIGSEMKDLIIASRYLDKFERRNGDWRIVRRDKVTDWKRIMEGEDPSFEQIPLRGSRDDKDASFQLFGKDAFHSLF